MRFMLSLLIALVVQASCAQQPEYRPDKKYSRDEIRHDLSILAESLKEYHPSVFRYISEEEFDTALKDLMEQITDSLTDTDMHVLARKCIVLIRCGHTVAKPSDEWYAHIRTSGISPIPFEVVIDDTNMFVSTLYTEHPDFQKGVQIRSIDGKSAADIIAQMKSIQQRDGFSETYVNFSIQRLFRTYYLFLYGASEKHEIVFKDVAGITKIVSLNSKPTTAPEAKMRIDTTAFALQSSINGLQYYLSKEDSALAYLDIRHFSRKKYKGFYKNIFRDMSDKSIEHLVIDLRDNTGGFFLHGNHLLRYLAEDDFDFTFSRPKRDRNKNKHLSMPFSSRTTRAFFWTMPDKVKREGHRTYQFSYSPKKKGHFSGTIYVLINGGSFSMSTSVAAHLKQQSNASIIGEESGGAAEGDNAIISHILTLPNSKVKVHIPYYFVAKYPGDSESGRGIKPDVAVEYTPQELLLEKNKEVEMVLRRLD